jgi:hypothetical protein
MCQRWPAAALGVVVTTSMVLSSTGCATHGISQRSAAEYVRRPPTQHRIVRIRAVLTTSGEKLEFPADHLALLIGDRVMSFSTDAELVTVRRADAEVLSRGTEAVAVRVQDDTYDNPLVVAETPESVTFVAAASPPEREIPLAEINQLWVETKGGSAIAATLVVGGVLLGVLLAVAAFALG